MNSECMFSEYVLSDSDRDIFVHEFGSRLNNVLSLRDQHTERPDKSKIRPGFR